MDLYRNQLLICSCLQVHCQLSKHFITGQAQITQIIQTIYQTDARASVQFLPAEQFVVKLLGDCGISSCLSIQRCGFGFIPLSSLYLSCSSFMAFGFDSGEILILVLACLICSYWLVQQCVEQSWIGLWLISMTYGSLEMLLWAFPGISGGSHIIL